MKKLTHSKANILNKLYAKTLLNGSEFKDKKFLAQLVEESILKIKQITPTKSKIELINKSSLDTYLKNEFQIEDLDKYIELLKSDNISRSELIEHTGDSKTKQVQTQTGIYLGGFENVILQFDEKKFNIVNILNGTSLFIHQHTKFEIAKDILIVGVENVENLLQIKRQKYLFEDIKKAKLFMLINPAMLKFIQNVENEYLHYGDIDLAGISIYETKCKPKVKNSSFFIPKNIELLIKKGNSTLYFKQYDKYKDIKSNERDLQKLIDLIHQHQKTIEQEIFCIS